MILDWGHHIHPVNPDLGGGGGYFDLESKTEDDMKTFFFPSLTAVFCSLSSSSSSLGSYIADPRLLSQKLAHGEEGFREPTVLWCLGTIVSCHYIVQCYSVLAL